MCEKTIRQVVAENPLLILLLGACPALGATTTVQGALGMGLAALVVMVLSGIVIALLHKSIPACGRIPTYVLVIAGFVSIVQMLMNAFLPNVYQMLGIYITVAAVDLLIFAVADTAEQGVGPVVNAAAKTGLRFVAVLLVMGLVRELLGNASLAGVELAILKPYRIPLMTMAPGGLLVYSFAAAVVSKLHPAARVEGEGVACAAAGICEISCEEVED